MPMNASIRLSCLVAAASAVLFVNLAPMALGQDDIVIGSTQAVTGQLASTGLTVLHSLEMAVEDINARGGVNGRKLRLVNEDAGATSSSAVSALTKVLEEARPVAVLLSTYSPHVLAEAGEVAREGVPALHAAAAMDIEALGNPWLFRLRPNDRINSRAIAELLAGDLGKTQPGLIYVQNDYGQGFERELRAHFAARGIQLAAESYGTGDNDLSAPLQNLMAQGVDSLATAGFNRDTALILKARTALGIAIPTAGAQAISVAPTTDLLDPGDLAGVYGLVDVVLPDRKAFDKTDFMRRYQARHNLEVDPSFITNTYDAVWMIAAAVTEVGEDRQKVRDYLAGLKDFVGLTRSYTTDARGNLAGGVVVFRFDDNKNKITIHDPGAPATAALTQYVVGATVPMTGQSAASGIYYHRALQLAEEDINAAGGINGVPLKFVFEDALSGNSTAVTAFIKLTQEQNPVAMFLTSVTPQNLAVEADVRRAGVPSFYAGGADDIHRLGNPWMFRIKQPDSVVAAAMADVALRDLQSRRPAVIYVQNDYGQGLGRDIERLLRVAGLDPIVESYGLEEKDFGSHVLAVTGQGADAIISVGYGRETALLLNARRNLGVTIPVVANPTLALGSTLTLLDPADIDGAFAVVDAYLPARAGFDRHRFVERFERRFGIQADPSYCANYYDAALMLADALRAVGPAPDAIRRYFAELKPTEGVTRRYVADRFGNLGDSVAVVKFAAGSKDFALVREFAGGGAAPEAVVAALPPTAVAGVSGRAAVQTVINGLAIGSIYALMALGFVIIYQATGVVNFATGQFVVVGAFLGVSSVAGLNNIAGLGFVAAIAAMVALGMLFFVAVYRPLQRSPVVTVVVGTIAVGIIVQNLCLLIWGPLPQRLASPFGLEPLALGGVIVSRHIIAVVGVTALVVAGLYVLLYRTALGARMRAVAQDVDAARLMGINVPAIYALTWALAGGLAGLGGVLMGPVWFVDASMGDALALKAFASTIIGGFGNVPGAVVGGLIVGLTEALGATYVSSTYKDAIVFVLMVAFLLIRPQGIFGEAGGDRA